MLKNKRFELDIENLIYSFGSKMDEISFALPELLVDSANKNFSDKYNYFKDNGIPDRLSARLASMYYMYSGLDIVDAALKSNLKVKDVAIIYYSIGARLSFGWLRELIKDHPVKDHWESLARGAFRDDLDNQQRNITMQILSGIEDSHLNDNAIMVTLVDNWLSRNKLLSERWCEFINELKTNAISTNFTTFAVALRELVDLVKISEQKQ